MGEGQKQKRVDHNKYKVADRTDQLNNFDITKIAREILLTLYL